MEQVDKKPAVTKEQEKYFSKFIDHSEPIVHVRHTSHGVQPVSGHEVHEHHHSAHDSEYQKTALEQHRLDMLSHQFDFMAKDSFYREVNRDFEDPYTTYSHPKFDQSVDDYQPKPAKTESPKMPSTKEPLQ